MAYCYDGATDVSTSAGKQTPEAANKSENTM